MDISRRKFIKVAGFSALGCGCLGCVSAPVTGRRRVILVPEGQELSLGQQAFQQTLANEQPSQNQRLANIVDRVGKRIAAVAGRDDFNWEFKLIASPTQNAFCLPGGKVAIYEGILPVCQDEGGLAVVMSHEIAHALARHGGERMSKNMISDGAKMVLSRVTASKFPERHEMLMQYYGHGSKFLYQLPYSRLQESEADHIGVMLMSKAGYDPTVAPAFWTRFGGMKEGEAATSEWFSTHPSDQRRASDLIALLDEAKSIYDRAGKKYGQGETLIG